MLRYAGIATLAVAVTACGGNRQVNSATDTAARAAAAAQQLADPVVSASFVVPPRTFKEFKIVVGPEMSSPRLEGTFTASGARHDIEVTLLEESQFLNWKNGHTYDSAYESGRVTAAKLKIEIPEPGTYFVVFSNRFSWMSQKSVNADVRLQYQRATR